MFYVNFLNTGNIDFTSTHFGLNDEVGTLNEKLQRGDEVFTDSSVFLEGRTINVVPGKSEKDASSKLFVGSPDMELKFNGKPRNMDDDVLMVTDKFRLLAGNKVLFRVIPINNNSAFVFILGGVMELLVVDEWFPFCRTANGYTDKADRKEIKISELLNFVKATDKESGYDMSMDGSTLVSMEYVKDSKGVSKVTTHCHDFILLDEKNRNIARERAKKKEEEVVSRSVRMKRLQAEYDKKMAMLNKKEDLKKTSSSGRHRKSSTPEQTVSQAESMAMFRNMLAQAGYKR